MPFGGLLQTLVSNVEGAQGAVMVAFDGEPVVEVVGKQGDLDRYGVQLLGAQLRILLTKFDRLHRRIDFHEPQGITLRMEDRSIFISYLNDQYFVLLTVANGFGLIGAEQKLNDVAQLMRQEM